MKNATMTIVRNIVVLASLSVLISGCSVFKLSSKDGGLVQMKEEPTFRIAVAVDQATQELTADTEFAVRTPGANGLAATFPAGTIVEFRAVRDGIEVWKKGGGREAHDPGPLTLIPDKAGFVTVGANRYRGMVEVRLNPRGSLTVINRVLLEDYLRGVVPNEIAHGDPALKEAVKAQAVAARTYALAYRGRNSAEGFDLVNTVMDQVYTGVGSESANADRAIAETRGMIALYRGEAIMMNYSSTCGGHTASRDEVWDKPPLDYLKGVSDKGGDGHFCSRSKYFRWTETWDGDAFWKIARENLVREYKVAIPDNAVLEDVKIAETGGSGRVRILEFRTDKGVFQARGDRIRWVTQRPAGAGPLRSVFFEASIKTSKGRVSQVTFNGRGWGHGVGMCQWGAMERSRRGQDFKKILEHYYSDIKLAAIY